ncbi:hypothetical protein HYZ99_03315 [Candidatus Peregrinibacteria bacterium]|nr:hypothetical protein [Candidatus Peregrinibacteria bacterium]
MRLTRFSEDRWYIVGYVVLILLLLAKYAWTLFAFEVPLGFDPGIYRYLFVKHTTAFPPFSIAPMDGWALEHPLGLFFFSTILLRLGLPVDALVGWVWNLVPIATALVLAFTAGRSYGRLVGFLTLLMALLSVAQYEGFLLMYWKTALALIFVALTFHFIEEHSFAAILFGMFAFATHHQTGFLLGLIVLTWLVVDYFKTEGGPGFRKILLLVVPALILGALWYVPMWDVVLQHLSMIFQGNAVPGTFPPPSVFLVYSGLLLLLGVIGFILSMDEGISIWHVAALWALIAVAAKFLFYRRFFLHLDFFLLPFAGYAVAQAWTRWKSWALQSLVCVLLLVQALFTLQAIAPNQLDLLCLLSFQICEQYPLEEIRPTIDSETFRRIADAAALPEATLILALEPETAPWLRGYLPNHRIAGPGVFESPWDYGEWEKFLLGTQAERRNVLRSVSGPAAVFLTDRFSARYGENAERFLEDPCLQKTDSPSLLAVSPSCTAL